jgi:hypothetical protein
MAVKNLQAVVQCAANICGVVVTGMRKESKRATEAFPAPFFSESSLRLMGPNPCGTNPDNGAILRAGRSASALGVEPGGWSTSYHRKPKAMPWTKTQLLCG